MTSELNTPSTCRCLGFGLLLGLVLAACGAPEPAKSEPAKSEPAKAEPAKPEPAKLEPAPPEPTSEPAKVVTVSPTGCKLAGESAEQSCVDLCERIEGGALAGAAAVRIDSVLDPSHADMMTVVDCLARAGISRLAIGAEAP